MNNGSGGLSPATPGHWSDTESTTDLDLGDLDGDGAIDAVLARRRKVAGTVVTLAQNDGTGTFGFSEAPTLQALEAHDVELSDLDGDGDLDLATSSAEPGSRNIRVGVLWNDGKGLLSGNGVPLGVEDQGSSRAILLEDLDGDDDTDVLAYGRILTNLQRSLAARAVARVGKPLVVEGYGSPGAQLILAVATTNQLQPLGTLGTLRIVPGTILLSLRGPLDAQGTGSARFRIPNDPTLSGATFHWQALIGDPVRLSNLETTTLSPW